ncbi:YceK/YidQ family lipoprotein [Gemmata sp. JC717]|uniref:YceK/YidQ family lipoprotein n=1 Tax=Gemmata algarum TaxID=2975278 RepID=A0ABU5F4B0_9BACT|nr:YceK/YidQ family lipoprotein [Gemmata algarum]MDY3556702.1 YceK/YidQ family lipoprotein [Gemmata algarum]MDY3561028.1 YceK/YidQ family lipoprotein [Gemmata algarum]
MRTDRATGKPAPREVFGGVRTDLEFATDAVSHEPPLAGIVAFIDLPFSLVGDVLTLPWTAKAACKRKASGTQP